MSGSRAMQSPKVPCRPGTRALAARHHLVPGAGAGARGGRPPAAADAERVRSARAWLSAIAARKFRRQQRRRRRRSRDRCSHWRLITCGGVARRPAPWSSIAAPSSASSVTSWPAFSLSFEAAPPGGEFVGPGLDGIDIAAGLLGGVKVPVQRSLPCKTHRRALPVAVAFAPPQQRRGDHVVAVAKEVGPHLDRLADDAFDRETAAVDQRIDVFNVKRPADRGALNGLGCLIHGDAK